MADVKISQLPLATSVADADILVINQGGVTKRVARSLVKNPGTVTSITAGSGLSGSTITTSGSIAVVYGSSANTAAQGNDSRLSDARVPTGAAGGDLSGTYPNPTLSTVAVSKGGTGRTAGNYSIYGLEIHVGKDGNDTTGDGTLINPVLTITKALTLVGSGRNTIVVHPGVYSESPTVSGTNTTITTSELTGANTLLSGTLTLNAAARVSGLKMSNLAITGTGNTYISNCTVDVNVTKSGSNYVEIINSELQCTSGIQITGAGAISIVGNKCWAVAVSNAAANVLLKNCFQVITPSVTAGNLQIDGCAIFAAAPTTNAVTSSAGSFIALANSFVLNSVGANVERVSLLGSYSILNLVYDKPNSTLTGTNLNAIDYFSVINADTLNLTNDLSVANGGTGASTGVDALANLGNTIFPVSVRQFVAMAPASSTATTMTFAVGAGIAGTAAIDGVTLSQGDTVVLLNNADQTQRGPWVITTLGTASVAAVLTRPSWFTTGTAKSGTLCQVQLGTTAAGYVLVLTTATAATTPIVVGTTSILVNNIWARAGLATTGTNLFTAYQSFRANGAGVNSAPFFFQAGAALMTAPQAHAVEWFNDTLFLTTAAGVRTTNVVSTTIPATSTSAGIVGQTAIDNANNWFYVCTATNVWKRIALTTF